MGAVAAKGEVQTVRGAIAPAELGLTMMHEHLFLDLRTVVDMPEEPEERRLANAKIELSNLSWATMNAMRSVDNLVLDDHDLAVREAGLFKDAGGGTLVDVTTPDFGRDPPALREVSERARIHVVMGSGYYHVMFHPPDMDAKSEATIADEIIADIREGVGGTGIRAGIIGEIGCSWPVRPNEEKVLRASAAAQRATGAAITIHPGRHPDSPFQIIEILDRAGADISRVVMGHMERSNLPPPRLREFARIGCYLEYDWFGEVRPTFPYGRKDQYIVDKQFVVDVPSDGERLKTLAALIDEGFVERILMSQDVCFKTRMAAYGGVGYAHIAKYVRRWMPEMGIGQEAIQTILFDNPSRVLRFA